MSLRLPFFVANVDLDKYISVTLPYLALASLNLLQLWAICWQHQSISIEPKTTAILTVVWLHRVPTEELTLIPIII